MKIIPGRSDDQDRVSLSVCLMRKRSVLTYADASIPHLKTLTLQLSVMRFSFG